MFLGYSDWGGSKVLAAPQMPSKCRKSKKLQILSSPNPHTPNASEDRKECKKTTNFAISKLPHPKCLQNSENRKKFKKTTTAKLPHPPSSPLKKPSKNPE